MKLNGRQKLSNWAKGGLTVIISVLIISVIANAGSLTPTASPAATSYTLTDIYNRLNTNAVATEGNHNFIPGASPAGTLYTLTQIYDKIPTIAASTVKFGTSYLGVDGTLVPSGTATGADCLDTKTFYSGDSWTQKTGSLATQILSAANDTVSAGNYNATTLSAVDTDLATGNIKSGVNLFGVDGDGNVVNTSTGDAAAGDILLNKKAWVDGSEITGNIANCSSEGGNICYAASGYWTASSGSNISGADGSKTFSISDGYYSGKTATCNDTDLAAGNIKKDVVILGTTGTLLPSGGDAATANVLADKTFFGGSQTDWNLQTGTMANNGAFGLTCGASDQAVTTGYYSGGTLTGDADLVAGNILSGVNIFGVAGNVSAGYTYGDEDAAYVLGTATGAGTALKDLWNGSLTAGGFDGGSQANGGVDDYNNAGSPPSDRYSKGWTQCDAGNTYCGTGLASADAKDDSTGLIWSLPCNGSGCASFSDSSPLTYTWDNSGANNNAQTASQLCSAGSHSESGWSLPHQKQLMQAYIDGSYGNLEASGVTRGYWSGTTLSFYTTNAWYTYLSYGYTFTYA